MQDELKACPWCKSTNIDWTMLASQKFACMTCATCGARGPLVPFEMKREPIDATTAPAITAWNTRVSTPPGDDEVERAGERLSRFAVEWRLLMARGRDEVVYELHPGSEDRWTECRIDDIETLIAAIPSRDDWRDIASAPKDGSFQIGARFGKSLELIWVHPIRWCTAAEFAEEDGGEPEDYRDGWDYDGDECSPSHWMPLRAPKAPSVTPGDAV